MISGFNHIEIYDEDLKGAKTLDVTNKPYYKKVRDSITSNNKPIMLSINNGTVTYSGVCYKEEDSSSIEVYFSTSYNDGDFWCTGFLLTFNKISKKLTITRFVYSK